MALGPQVIELHALHCEVQNLRMVLAQILVKYLVRVPAAGCGKHPVPLLVEEIGGQSLKRKQKAMSKTFRTAAPK